MPCSLPAPIPEHLVVSPQHSHATHHSDQHTPLKTRAVMDVIALAHPYVPVRPPVRHCTAQRTLTRFTYGKPHNHPVPLRLFIISISAYNLLRPSLMNYAPRHVALTRGPARAPGRSQGRWPRSRWRLARCRWSRWRRCYCCRTLWRGSGTGCGRAPATGRATCGGEGAGTLLDDKLKIPRTEGKVCGAEERQEGKMGLRGG